MTLLERLPAPDVELDLRASEQARALLADIRAADPLAAARHD